MLSFITTTGRTATVIRGRWETRFIEWNDSPLNEKDLRHALRFQRNSNHSNEHSKMAKQYNRDPKRQKSMWKSIMRAAKERGYIEEEQFRIEPEGEAFEVQVRTLMPSIEKFNNSNSAKGAMKKKKNNAGTALSSEMVEKRQADFEKKMEKKRKREDKRAKKEEMENDLQKLRITNEEKAMLADETCEEEWVKEHRDREKWLIANGVDKESLDEILEHYYTKLCEGNMVASNPNNLLWQLPRQPKQRK